MRGRGPLAEPRAGGEARSRPSGSDVQARAAGAERCASDEGGGRGPLAEPTAGGHSSVAHAALSDG